MESNLRLPLTFILAHTNPGEVSSFQLNPLEITFFCFSSSLLFSLVLLGRRGSLRGYPHHCTGVPPA